MNIFPTAVEVTSETAASAGRTSASTTTFVFDFSAGEFATEDGRVKTATEKDKICIWIEKLIRTRLDAFAVYAGTTYGVKAPYKMFGMKNREYIEAELSAELLKKISANEEIVSVSNLSVEFVRNVAHVTMNVLTVYDEEAINIEYYS